MAHLPVIGEIEADLECVTRGGTWALSEMLDTSMMASMRNLLV